MKKIFFVAMVLIFSMVISTVQCKTPAAVTTAFNQKFPDATKVKWGKENAHNYEAEFMWKDVNYSANFSDTGEWLETEIPTTFSLLPEKVQAAFNATHKKIRPKAVSKIETSKRGTIYEVEVAQGVKTVELFYTTDGNVTKE